MPKVKSFKHIGNQQTYDLEVNHADHQYYLANGLLTSNSHAASYAINSYYCAWLLTYYETEWTLAYLESTSGGKKAPKALSDVKAQGYDIVPIDINHADRNWIDVGEKKLMPSFVSCKGLGDTAIEEILSFRPYRSIEHFLWNDDGSWRHSKCNKRAIEALIRIRAFESFECVGPNKQFESYKHMHRIIIGHYDELRKAPKKNPNWGRQRFAELLESEDREPEWSFQELVESDNELLGTVNVEALIPAKIKRYLREKNVRSLDELDEQDLYWFMVTKVMQKKTKTGKPYFLLECISSSSTVHKIFCWDATNKEDPPLYTLTVGEVSPGSFGMSTKYSKIKFLNI